MKNEEVGELWKEFDGEHRTHFDYRAHVRDLIRKLVDERMYRMHLAQALRGERAPRSKLVVAQVREIKNKLQSGATFRHLAEEYRVSPRNIRSIAQGRIWKQVENGFRIAQL